jgi:hypothetical protein
MLLVVVVVSAAKTHGLRFVTAVRHVAVFRLAEIANKLGAG